MNHRAWIFSLGLGACCLAALPAQAQLFGPSDEEIAREKSQDDQLAALPQMKGQLDQDAARLQQLEDKVQSLTQSLSQATGANEELNHQLSLLNDKLDRQQKDFAYRLCMLSAQQLGAGGDDQGLNCAAAGSNAPANGNLSLNRPQPGTVLPPLDGGSNNSGAVPRGRPPGTLGTLPSGPPPLQGNSGQFDTAMNLLGKAQYAEASAAFRAYADANPDDDDLSSQSIYWIGNIAFVRQDYPTASRAFAELLKKYPGASRAPDGMLKLGQSLLAQGQTSGGCTTLGLLSKKYPKASPATLAAATGARKASCSK